MDRKRKRSPSPGSSSKSQRLQLAFAQEEKNCIACGATGHVETECNELSIMGQQLRDGQYQLPQPSAAAYQPPQPNFAGFPLPQQSFAGYPPPQQSFGGSFGSCVPVLNDMIMRQQVALQMQLEMEAQSPSSTLKGCWVCKKSNHSARDCTEQIKCLSCGEHTSACLHKGLDATYQCDLCGSKDHCFGQCDKYYQQGRI